MNKNVNNNSISIQTIVEKVLNEETISTGEWFRCLANISDCNIFSRIPTMEARLKVYNSLTAALPDIEEKYDTYNSILLAIKKSVVKEAKIIESNASENK